jgi:hypothetical protein
VKGLGVALDKLDFVTFGGIDKSEHATGTLGGAIAEGITFGGCVFGKSFKILHLKSKMGEIGPDGHRTTARIIGDFDQLLAFGSFEENELGAAWRLVTFDLLQSQNVLVEGDGFLQVINAIAGVQEFGNHVRKCLKFVGDSLDAGGMHASA